MVVFVNHPSIHQDFGSRVQCALFELVIGSVESDWCDELAEFSCHTVPAETCFQSR